MYKKVIRTGFLIITLACVFLSTSCIQDEALNPEADIVAVDTAWVRSVRESGLLVGTPIVENNRIIFMVKKGANLSKVAPQFDLSLGASISPLSGDTLNFTTPQKYTVTSQDGNWTKEYEVSFLYLGMVPVCHFEHWEYEGRVPQYQRVFDISSDGYIPWASGNSGFALTGAAKSSEDYPTSPAENGVNGLCAKLETKSTGKFGQDMKMPIASGNLFIGEFNAANALLSALRATKFGLPVLKSKPLSLRGYYKYKAGKVFTDANNKPVEGMKDACDIYAVVYEVDAANPKSLDGSNILDSDKIVLLARIKDAGEPEEWTRFSIPFEQKNGKVFDYDRMEKNGYNVTIVFSSSIDGAYFNGAVGSTLYIDEVELVCEKN